MVKNFIFGKKKKLIKLSQVDRMLSSDEIIYCIHIIMYIKNKKKEKIHKRESYSHNMYLITLKGNVAA